MSSSVLLWVDDDEDNKLYKQMSQLIIPKSTVEFYLPILRDSNPYLLVSIPNHCQDSRQINIEYN
jgi:hypothetical protein